MPGQIKSRCWLLTLLIPLLIWHHWVATIPAIKYSTVYENVLTLYDSDQELDLITGEIRKTSPPRHTPAQIVHAGKQYEFELLPDTKHVRVTIAAVDASQIAEHKVIELSRIPQLVGTRYLLAEDYNKLQVVDLEDAALIVRTHTIFPDQRASIQVALHSDGFIRTSQRSGQTVTELFRIDNGVLRLLNSWPGDSGATWVGDRLYILDRANKRTEVRAATDGSLIQRQPWPDTSQDFNGVAHTWLMNHLLVLTDRDYKNFVAVDLDRNQRLKLPSTKYFPNAMQNSRNLILTGTQLKHRNQLLIFDPDAQGVVQTINVPFEMDSHHGLADNCVVATGKSLGLTAARFDMKTGVEIHRWQPFAWLSRSGWLLTLCVCIWIAMWLQTSQRYGGPPLLDLVILTALCATIAAYRAGQWASLDNKATLLLLGMILMSVVSCATWWTMVGYHRWTLCVSLWLLAVASSQLVLLLVSDEPTHKWPWMLAAFASSIYIAMVAGLVRLARGRWLPPSSETQRVTLLDILGLTAAAALLVAVIRETDDASRGYLPGDWELTIAFCVPSLLSVFGLAIGFTRTCWLHRAMLISAISAIALVVTVRMFEHSCGLPVALTVVAWMKPESYTWDQYETNQVQLLGLIIEALVVGLVAPFLATIPLRLAYQKPVSSF